MQDTAKFEPLGDKLVAWVDEQLQLLAAYYDSLDVPMPETPSAESLDDLWMAWKATGVTDRDAVDSFLNSFGIGFGQLLTECLEFEWTYLEDEYGADIAVRAFPGTANTRIAPLHFVLKRWQTDEDRYIEHAIGEIDGMLTEHAEEHGIER